MTIHDRSEHIEFSMTFDAPVTVTGDPTFAFDLGGATTATYYAGSGTTTLRFSHAVSGGTSGDRDTNGISWAENAIALNGGTIAGTDNGVYPGFPMPFWGLSGFFVGEAGQAARRAPGALAAGIVRSGPGAGRDVREWETDMECTSEPDGLAAGAGALPRARRRCEAGKRTHGPGTRACLALLAATALLALAAPAQAQTEIWSATLTPQDLGSGALGCNSTAINTAVECSNTDVLSDNDFTLGSTEHTIGIIELGVDETLQITSTRVFTDADTLVLVLGTTSLAFSDGITGSDGAGRVWLSTGISWTAGTDVSVRLISLTAPGAPTGLAATANGPSQIDLAWTAPASTGGSAITGYKIEVSPDGSSWSDLVDNTGSIATAYAHMELDPATTRHYRVSAINAVGTSDASDSADTTTASTNTAAMGAPTITGTAQVGQTLTAATTGITDADGLTSVSYTYQWIRVATDNTETNISSATASTYMLVAADQGTTVQVTVSFTDDANNPETRTSAATATVAAAPNTAATGAPTITGTAQVGQTLTAGTTAIMDADGLTSVSYTYQWIRVATDNTETNIASATASTYMLVAADQGTTLKVTVSFTDDASNAETLTSAATAAVSAAANTPATGAPTITGTAQVGQTLTASTTGIADANGLTTPNYTYQWIRVDGTDEADIASANSSTYILVAADQGTTLKVRVTFADDLGHTEMLTSAATATVGAAATGPPTVNDVAVTSTPASGTTYYLAGEVIEFTVTFRAPVTVTATPKFAFRLGAATRQAAYASGSDSVALVFARTVQAGEVDRNGISWNALALALDGGTITQTGATTAARLTHAAQAPLEGHRVDAAPPMQVSASVQGLSLVLVYDEPLDPAAMPATGAYTVTATVGATTTTPAVSAVSIYGIWVTLTLDAAPAAGATVTLAYAPPASNPVQDEAGNDAPAFSGQSVRLGQPPPDLAQVMGVGVAPGNAQLVVTWTAVDTATGYTVQWTSGSEDYTTGDRQAPVTSGSTTRYTIPSLINGTAYTVRVIATRTGATDGPPSAEVTATPAVPTREPFEVDIVGVPEAAVTGESYELTVQSDEDSLVYAWRVDGGAIEPDDVQMVVWTAPETAGVAWIHVDVTREDGAKAGQSAYVRVEVPEPEPEPVPALPLLGQLLLALGLAGAGAMRLVRSARRP